MAKGGRNPIIAGEKSGYLTVLDEPREPVGERRLSKFWLSCLCEKCGVRTKVLNIKFRRLYMCVKCSGVRGANRRVKHGGSRQGALHPLYGAWQSMNSRCHNPNDRSYHWYGAKGIRVCAAWRDFAVFSRWAEEHGYVKGLTLDRLDAHRGYEPNNCEYVTGSENSRRMRAMYRFVPITQQTFPYEALLHGSC